MARRRRCSRLIWTIFALALTSPLACGGGSDGAGEILFAGTASELAPHPTGRSSAFRVTASDGDHSEVSGLTSTVIANAADGTFVTRYVSAAGSIAESTSRDTGDEIRVERFVNDPGGPAEEVVSPDPPVGVVRTPVVAGEPISSSFARTLEIELRIGDTRVRSQLLFVGSARRVPEERGEVTVPADTYSDAIRYAVEASGETRVVVLGQSIVVAVEVSGDEWFAPGVGGVKEELDVVVSAGGESATLHFTTEREG